MSSYEVTRLGNQNFLTRNERRIDLWGFMAVDKTTTLVHIKSACSLREGLVLVAMNLVFWMISGRDFFHGRWDGHHGRMTWHGP